ncbi:hypothetical protein GUJ93_ZPchr0039g14218 [Zizania palustris]|uniref:Flavoprotein pyridine nucleotide cytochrome reductase-like FAD-binding domain-containing protein n=1 Tax=Zizania palustris TaxID=103762 RepID=A0A8J5R6S0_ZIZPA|nr:hypothetical protein GUJ93_ZPchr0039g14218 [Zizania palustris]
MHFIIYEKIQHLANSFDIKKKSNMMDARCGCLDPENFKEFTLVEKRDRSRPSSGLLSRVQTPTRLLLYWAFQIPIGQHISCRGQDAAGEEVIKPCTPTTLDSDLGYFELVIKV